MDYKEFGLRLKNIRRSNNYTQLDLATKLNITRQAYSNYEQGRCLPPPGTLAELSVLLNTNLFILFLQDATSKHYHQQQNNNPTISTEELNSLIELYSLLPINKRNSILEHMIIIK